MITHDDPSEHYITKILINNEYHGYCYLNDSNSTKRCDIVDCNIYHDEIVSSTGMMKFEFYYSDHKDQSECTLDQNGTNITAASFASIELRLIGTGKLFIFMCI